MTRARLLGALFALVALVGCNDSALPPGGTYQKFSGIVVDAVTNRPIAGAVRLFGFTVGGNRTLIASLDDGVLAPVKLMLSGHIHAFEAINYEGDHPPQLLAGNGGDKLDKASASLANTNLGTWHVKDGISLPGFGFLLMTQEGTDWRIDVHGVDGAIERVCRFANDRLDCPEE